MGLGDYCSWEIRGLVANGVGDWGSGIFNTIANGFGQLKRDGGVVILLMLI